MKPLHVFVQVLLFLFMYTVVSLVISYKQINFQVQCLAKYENKINPPCNVTKNIDALLALPTALIQNFILVQFAWSVQEASPAICTPTYEGLKIGSVIVFTSKSYCQPI